MISKEKHLGLTKKLSSASIKCMTVQVLEVLLLSVGNQLISVDKILFSPGEFCEKFTPLFLISTTIHRFVNTSLDYYV